MAWISPHFSHSMCLRRFKKPIGQEPRAARCGAPAFAKPAKFFRCTADAGFASAGEARSGKRGDAPCRLLQPALRVAFRRASTASGVSTVWPDTVFAARRRICLAERATQATSSVRNAGCAGASIMARHIRNRCACKSCCPAGPNRSSSKYESVLVPSLPQPLWQKPRLRAPRGRTSSCVDPSRGPVAPGLLLT